MASWEEMVERHRRRRELKASNDRKRAERIASARSIKAHTKEEWDAVVREVGGLCVRCGCRPDRVVRDHIVPIRFGGHDGIDNLQPLCVECNSAKGSEAINWLARWRLARSGREGQ